MKAVRIYTGADGETYFAEIDILEEAGSTGMLPTTGALFHDTRGPFTRGQHTATTRQLVIVLAGTMEMESGTGEVCRVGPGEVALMENTQGRGHTTRWRERGLTAVLPVSAEFSSAHYRLVVAR